MNDINPDPQPTPSVPPLLNPATRPLGDDAAERVPITSVITAIESVLRHPRRIMFQLRQPGAGKLIASMLFATVIFSLIYGVIVGSFSGGMQWWAAPVKLSGGLLVTTIICLPSLYIFGCLSGSQARLIEICGLVAGLLMLMTLLLIGFAPVAWLFSQSTESLVWMGALHLLFWGIATAFGMRFVHAGFSHSKASSNAGLVTWLVIFVLVALQMTTALRPILGKSDQFFPTTKQFFMNHWSECVRDAGHGRQDWNSQNR